jgi:hypothetical protein
MAGSAVAIVAEVVAEEAAGEGSAVVVVVVVAVAVAATEIGTHKQSLNDNDRDSFAFGFLPALAVSLWNAGFGSFTAVTHSGLVRAALGLLLLVRNLELKLYLETYGTELSF